MFILDIARVIKEMAVKKQKGLSLKPIINELSPKIPHPCNTKEYYQSSL